MIKVKYVDSFELYKDKHCLTKILEQEFGEVIESDDPDFLFYSVPGNEHLKYDCARIFWCGENMQPDFNICDYAIAFSRLKYEDRYKRIPLYYFYIDDYKKAVNKHKNIIPPSEKKFCNFVYSNARAMSSREEFFDKLSKYKTVDSGGKFKNNVGGPVPDKYEFQKQYKFSIAFENSITNGYTTEKILQAFAAGTIPIYYGNPKVAEDFNEKAFINCHAYKNFDEVIERIIEIDQNDDLYLEYISQPIGNAQQCPADPLSEYNSFIKYICSQNPKDAIRRTNEGIQGEYQKHIVKLNKYDRVMKYLYWDNKIAIFVYELFKKIKCRFKR